MAEDAKDRFVKNNLDALLTALYVHLDDRVLPALGWSREPSEQRVAGSNPARRTRAPGLALRPGLVVETQA